MKMKLDHVTNSSSTSYMITNKTDKELSLAEFVKENPHLVEFWRQSYGYTEEDGFTQEQLVKDAEKRNPLGSGENHVTFGDNQGDHLGHAFDYILRDYPGESERFKWRKHSDNR
jgi:hypothetical protein